MAKPVIPREHIAAGRVKKQARQRYTVEAKFTYGIAAEFRPEWHVYSRYGSVRQRDQALRQFKRRYGNIMELRKGHS